MAFINKFSSNTLQLYLHAYHLLQAIKAAEEHLAAVAKERLLYVKTTNLTLRPCSHPTARVCFRQHHQALLFHHSAMTQ